MSASELYRRCAGLFMVGFPGTAPDAEVLGLIDDGIAGAILFKRNVGAAADTAALIRALKVRAGRPFLAAVDQEGGRVARLRGAPFTSLPPMRALAAAPSGTAARVGRLLAYEVRAVGFDWDFAPVLDVDTNPDNPVIGDRSFSRDAARVAALGVELAQAMEAAGVASSAKHFPGHGDTAQDSHHHLPHLVHDLARLRAVELVPFAAYARAGLASVMTAHVVFDALEPSLPATLSARVLQGLLREELGFGGVLVSDDLEMKAIADHFPIGEAVVQGVEAGVDLFLVCHAAQRQREGIEALVRAVERGRISKERLAQSLSRNQALARRFAHGPEDGVAKLGSAEHRALAQGLSADDFSGVDPTER